MLTDWDDFAHARTHTHTNTHKCASEQHERANTPRHTPMQNTLQITLRCIQISQYHTLFFFLTNVNNTRFPFSGLSASAELLFCQTAQVLTCSYRSLTPINPSIDMSAVDEQVKFQEDKCQHAPYRTLKHHCFLFVTPSYGSQISLIAYTPPPQPSTMPPARAGAEWRSADLGRVVSAGAPSLTLSPMC